MDHVSGCSAVSHVPFDAFCVPDYGPSEILLVSGVGSASWSASGLGSRSAAYPAP